MSTLAVRNLGKTYWGRDGRPVRVLQGVTFSVLSGGALGVMGESGAGKTTLGRCITRLIEPSEGKVLVDGRDWLALDREGLRLARRKLQMVPQDPAVALNPMMKVLDLVREPLDIHSEEERGLRSERALAMIRKVGLSEKLVRRRPGELSGGQCQRVAIARALVLEPRILLADEPTASVDAAARNGIVELLNQLRRDLGLTLLVIGHDLGSVRRLCDRSAVMYQGRIVELARTDDIFDHPIHPYSRQLIHSVELGRPLEVWHGASQEPTKLQEVLPGHWVASRGPLNPG